MLRQILLLALLIAFPAAPAFAGGGDPSAEAGEPRVEDGEPRVEDAEIVLPDGTKLAHTLVRPATGDAPLPVVLVRTPYFRRSMLDAAKQFAQRGCAVVLQDVRGRGESAGVWEPFVHEADDGGATVDWIVAQPWCNGRIGTYGQSYLGITQWQLAPRAGAHLACMVNQFSSADLYRDVVHFGGVQGLYITLSWSLTMAGRARGPTRFDHLPLIEADDASGGDVPAWDDWSHHHVLDGFWKPMDFHDRYAQVHGAALLVAGWYDLFLPGQIDDYVQLARRGGAPEESFTRLIVGPWDHGGTARTDGRPDLGPQAWISPHDEEQLFLARFLLGAKNGFEKKAGVHAFFLGENRWRDLDGWPPKPAEPRDLYLRSLGGAARKPGDGTLLATAPTRAEPTDSYAYDPRDPCPSYATNLWTPLATLRDEREIAARPDVLDYASLPLDEDLLVAGPLELTLWIESDAPDTDFAAKLVDVAPDGATEWRGEGIQRARMRDSVYSEKLLTPGAPARLVVRMGHIACRIAKGHRIGLQVTSSNFPRFSRNLNTAEPSAVATTPTVAHQRVLHDSEHASVLRLYAWTEHATPAGEGH